MSLWNDFVNFVEDTADSIGDAVQSAWDAVKHNPIGAITSAVAMAYGIPPTWAGALGGAAGAAATGGNVVKAAITGGAMGYMGSAAGAAAGSAGPIAAAAASGAAAGVTGAVLTGQDVVTALKQGLILGTVAGGVQQFMTPSEAMSKISTADLAEANLSSDPIGTLAKSQGWYDSVSATSAASQALQAARSDGTLRNYYADQIPDSVLQKALQSDNPALTVTKEMGWSMSGPQVGGVYDALNDYKMASTPAVAAGTGAGANALITPTNPTGAPLTPAQAAATASQQINSTGLVSGQDASILASNGFTAADVKSLVNLGYSGADLVNMAATGVTPATLTTLANTQFPEHTINELLSNGASANDISKASWVVSNKGVPVNTATQLLEKGVSGADIYSMSFTSPNTVNQALDLANKGVDPSSITKLYQSGYDLGKIGTALNDGRLTSDTVNTNITSNTAWSNYINKQLASPVPPQAATGVPGPTATTVAPVSPTDLAASISKGTNYSPTDIQTAIDKGYSVQQISNAVSNHPNGGYMQDLIGQAPGTQPVTPTGSQYAQAPSTTVTDVGTEVPYRVDMSGVAGTTEAPNAVTGPLTQGTQLATPAQIDSGAAQWNAGANAWEVPVTPAATTPTTTTPITPIIVPPTSTVSGPVTPTTVASNVPTTTVPTTNNGNTNVPVVVPTTTTTTVPTTTTPTGNVAINTGTGQITGGGTTTGTGTGTGTGTVGNVTIPTGTTGNLSPINQEIIPNNSSQVANVTVDNTSNVANTTGTTDTTAIIPIVVPTDPNNPTGAYHYGTYTLGKGNKINVPTGLNPGWIAPTPQYQTTSPAQAQYYWGSHPYQPGPEFNAQLYNNVPAAPQQAWGTNYTQTSATPQQILQAMGMYYPLMGSVNGPVRP